MPRIGLEKPPSLWDRVAARTGLQRHQVKQMVFVDMYSNSSHENAVTKIVREEAARFLTPAEKQEAAELAKAVLDFIKHAKGKTDGPVLRLDIGAGKAHRALPT